MGPVHIGPGSPLGWVNQTSAVVSGSARCAYPSTSVPDHRVVRSIGLGMPTRAKPSPWFAPCPEFDAMCAGFSAF